MAKAFALRFKMKKLMTAEKWKALSGRMLGCSVRYHIEAEGAQGRRMRLRHGRAVAALSGRAVQVPPASLER